MSKTLGILHTTLVTVSPLTELAARLLPGWPVINLLDDSLLPAVIRAGTITPQIAKRIAWLALALQDAGADLILGACSSVGEAVENLQPLLRVPVLRIDQPLAEKAVRLGKKIGVLATVKTTLEPTVRLLEREAGLNGSKKELKIERGLCEDAYQALQAGRLEEHDRLAGEGLQRLIGRGVEVVVLAQASLARLLEALPAPPVPVLSSPPLALAKLQTM